MSAFYRVVEDISLGADEACKNCGHGKHWTIVHGQGDDETAVSNSWGDKEIADDICGLMNTAHDAGTESELVPRETFDAELQALGERMAADGKIVIKQLLHQADVHGRDKCLFDNWPAHLKADAYSKLGLEPVQMFRRVRT